MMKKIIIPIILFLFFIILIYTSTNDNVWYHVAKIMPKLKENIMVIKIGLNDKDIPREYDTAIIRELRKKLMNLINEEKEIKIKRYGDGWFSRKKMGVDFYRGAFDYLAISKETYDSDGFQKAMRKYRGKMSVKIIHKLEIHAGDKNALKIVLLLKKSPPEKLIRV